MQWHLVIFFVNVVLVLVGYYATIKFNALAPVKVARIGFLAVSLLLLLPALRKRPLSVGLRGHYIMGGFVVLNLLVVPFALNVSVSLERLLTLVPFFVYINLFAWWLVSTYAPAEARYKVVAVTWLAYCFPVVCFYAVGNSGSINIYGDASSGFQSNQLGWSCAVVLTAAADLYSHRQGRVPLWAVALFGLGGLAALYLLLISGSRSGYLCVAVLLLMQLLGRNRLGFAARLAAVVVTLGATIYLLADPESALNHRYAKTRAQLETREARQEAAVLGFRAFDRRENLILHGVGFDYYYEGLTKVLGRSPAKAHNSYLEILFDSGIFVFGYFLFLIVLPALGRFIMRDARRWSYLPVVLIIAYFESNYGAGQFLFFPWFFWLCFYLHPVAKGV